MCRTNKIFHEFKLCFLLIIVLFSSQILAQSPQGVRQQLQRIMLQTMAYNGELTRQMHRKFWNEINKLSKNEKEKNQMIEVLRASILLGQERQKEFWESAKISHQNSRVVKTQRLIEIDNQALGIFKKSLPFSKRSKNYAIAVKSYNNSMKIGKENSRRILVSTANHQTTVKSVQGDVVNVDIETINTVLENLSSVYLRLKKLLNEDWKAE